MSISEMNIGPTLVFNTVVLIMLLSTHIDTSVSGLNVGPNLVFNRVVLTMLV